MIGVFDSGLGGIMLLDNLAKNYPNQTFLFHAEREKAPFGNKSDAELITIFEDNYAFFKANKCSDIVLACNTLCSTIDFSKYHELKVHDIIEPTVNKMNLDKDARILVLATDKTTKKGRYTKLLNQNGYSNITAIALSELASMIETYQSQEDIKAYILSKTANLGKFDGVVLACTHYPAVSDVFAEIFQASIFDSNNLDFVFNSYEQALGEIIIDLKPDSKLESFLHRHLTVGYRYYENCSCIR